MKQSLNLISERARKRELLHRCLRLWSRVLAGSVTVLVLYGVSEWRACQVEQSRYAAVDAEYEPIRQLKIENGRLQKEINALREADRIPLELAKSRPLLGLLGLATSAVTQQHGKVYLKQLEIERDPLDLSSTTNPMLRFAIEGVSVDSSAVTRLADGLRDDGPFANVELNNMRSTLVGKQEQQTFNIQCTN
ncbi:MAG: PilN domain-containing protein [Bythopirellula sp.]